MKIQKKYICLTLAVIILTSAFVIPNASAVPTVPSMFTVSVFATGFSTPTYLEFGPGGPAFGSYLYVSDTVANQVFKVDCSGSKIPFVTTGITRPTGLAFGTGSFGPYLYVGSDMGDVYKVDSSGSMVTPSPFVSTLGNRVGSIEFGPGGAYGTDLYVAEWSAGIVSRINSGGIRTIFCSVTGTDFRYLTFDRYGRYGGLLYVPDYTWTNVYRLNNLGQLFSFASVAPDIVGPQFSPAGAFGQGFYLGNYIQGLIYSILPNGSWSVWGSGFSGIADITFAAAPPFGPAMYVSDANASVIYKITPKNQWVIEPVPSSVGGQYSSLKLDSGDNTHISYFDNNHLMYVLKGGLGSWSSIEPVDTTTNDVGRYNSLALDSNGRPLVTYYDSANGDLKAAFRTGGPGNPWSFPGLSPAVVDDGGGPPDVGRYTSVAFDNNDIPHIAYQDYTNHALKYAWWGGWTLGWQNTVVESLPPGNFPGMHSSLAFDQSSGKLHISYYNYKGPAGGELRYAWKQSVGAGSWNIGVVVDSSSTDTGRSTSITLDSNGDAHISYYDYSNGRLKHAWQVSSVWTTTPETIDTGVGPIPLDGRMTSIAFDSIGNVLHISYLWNNKLKHAWKSLACPAATWSTEIVDSNTNAYKSTSIDLDSLGNPHISYYDSNNDRLMHAFIPPLTATVQSVAGPVTCSTSGGGFTTLTASPPPPPPPSPPSNVYIFLYGLLSWTVSGLTQGQTITVTITYPNAIPSTATYWKYIPSLTPPWTDVTLQLLGDNDGDNVLTLTITDGGFGDLAPPANGVISDPGGVGVPVLLAPYLKAPTLVNPLMAPGTSFAIDILVNNVAYLTNAVINLHYNSSMLTATTAGYRLVSPVIFETDSVTIDNVNGNVNMTGHRRTTSVPPYLNTTSNLPLAYIVFTINDIGTTALDLHDTQLINKNGMQIIHSDIDGFLDCRLEGTMSAPHIVNTALSPGDYFDVYVSVGPWMSRPVEKLWGFQFIMDFDPNIIMPVDFETLGIFMQGPSEIGAEYVAVTGNSYYGDPNGLTTSVPVEVARIGFVVNNTGVTLLTLHDTAMVNVYGATMIHETISGSFANTMNISVSLNTIFVEKRKWSKSTDGELITLTAQVTNTGDGITKTRAVFDVYSGGVKVAHAVTDEVDIWPGTTIRLEVELNLSPLPEGSYAVEGTVEYINYLGTWVKGRRGSPIGARTSMVKTLILYP